MKSNRHDIITGLIHVAWLELYKSVMTNIAITVHIFNCCVIESINWVTVWEYLWHLTAFHSGSSRQGVFCYICCMKLLQVFVQSCTVGLSCVWCVLNIFFWSSTEGQQIWQLSHMSKAGRHPLHSALNTPVLARVTSRLFLGLIVFLRKHWHHRWNWCSHTINNATNSCDFTQAQTTTTISHHYDLR